MRIIGADDVVKSHYFALNHAYNCVTNTRTSYCGGSILSSFLLSYLLSLFFLLFTRISLSCQNLARFSFLKL